MNTFYFNTGVVPYDHTPPVILGKGEVWCGGVKQVPFDCDNVPDHATFMFACDNPDLREAHQPNFIVRPIFNSVLCSKFAYFKIKAVQDEDATIHKNYSPFEDSMEDHEKFA